MTSKPDSQQAQPGPGCRAVGHTSPGRGVPKVDDKYTGGICGCQACVPWMSSVPEFRGGQGAVAARLHIAAGHGQMVALPAALRDVRCLRTLSVPVRGCRRRNRPRYI